MAVEDIEWSDQYSVGVGIIDRAHQELFRMTSRLGALSRDKTRLQWAGEEGLKFLKKYVENHFVEEEAYMRSISYPWLERHALQHQTMREKILPRMEEQLKNENYSAESIEKFVLIMRLWLSRHILTHDVIISKPGMFD